MKVAVYDTKPYDREFLISAGQEKRISWDFFDFRISKNTKETARGYDAVCAFVNDQIDRECLRAFSEYGIRLIALRCAGYNNVDVEAAKEYHIPIVRVPAYSPHAVAEHAVGLLLTLNRKIHKAYNRVREMNFSINGLMGFDIFGKTVGVIGTGKIGKVFAKILQGFDAKVIVYDVAPSHEWAKELGISYVDMDFLLKQSDIISLHVPLLPDTFHLINENALKKMKQHVFLINTSRGKIVETAALIEALKANRIAGVALDVYEEEEGIFFEDLSDKILQDDELARLLSFPNVLITGHQAFFTREAMTEIARITTENLMCLQQQKPFLPGTFLV